MSWGQALQIGGMAEQDIASFIAAGVTTRDLLQAKDAARARIAEYYPQAKAQYEPYAGLGQEGMAGMRAAAGTQAAPYQDFAYREPTEAELTRPEQYDRPDFQFRFQEDPGYQFRLAEGQKAIEGSAAARGQALSGATQKALAQYSGNMASDEYGQAYNRAMDQYKFGVNADVDIWGRKQQNYESARNYGLANRSYAEQARQTDVTNRYNRAYQPALQQMHYGTAVTGNLADLIYNYGLGQAGMDIQRGNIKAYGHQAAADAAIQQGQHLQEIGGGGGGGSSSGGGGGGMNIDLSGIGTGGGGGMETDGMAMEGSWA